MEVKELIELTNKLAMNHTDLSVPKVKDTYLSFLNMANLDLYKVAASGLDTIVQSKKTFVNLDNVSFSLPNDFFTMSSIFVNSKYVSKGNVRNKSLTDPTQAQYYIYQNLIYLNTAATNFGFLTDTDPADNVIKNYIEIIYYPNPLKLVEVINNPLTETNIPIYPEPFHFYLIHGALYYFYLANRVFLEKRVDIRELWDRNKKELADYKNYSL